MRGLTENAGHEIDGPIFEEFARHESAGQNIDDSVDTRSAETRVATRHKCDARADTSRSSCLQLLPESPLTWKSSQSLQQVMPWLVAGRLLHIFVAGRLVVVSHRLDYFLCAQAGDLSPISCDLPQSSNWSKNRHERLLRLFRLSLLPLLS